MPQTEARPTAKNRHGGAPRGARPALWDARRCAQRLACRARSVHAPLTRQARRVPLHPCACRRSAHPSRWGFNFMTRAQSRRGNEICCLTSEDGSAVLAKRMKLSIGLMLRSIAANEHVLAAVSNGRRCVSKHVAAPASQVGYSRLAHLKCRCRVNPTSGGRPHPSRRAAARSILPNAFGPRALSG